MRQDGFQQMVKVPTRGSRILDVFLTNTPLLWDLLDLTIFLYRPWYLLNRGGNTSFLELLAAIVKWLWTGN